jgi:hypothetical protein
VYFNTDSPLPHDDITTSNEQGITHVFSPEGDLAATISDFRPGTDSVIQAGNFKAIL